MTSTLTDETRQDDMTTVRIRAFAQPTGIEADLTATRSISAGSPAIEADVTYPLNLHPQDALANIEHTRYHLAVVEANLIGDVLAARAAGCSWATIAQALGITKQSAMARYSRWAQ